MTFPANAGNLFTNIPDELPEELIETLAAADDLRVERIVSRGHASPSDYWYDQEFNEFVVLLKGRAGLVFEGRRKRLEMKAGDYINIPAHLKHRVAWTDTNQDSIWLAIHYR
jgi:cupin 2 domain-containing protein